MFKINDKVVITKQIEDEELIEVGDQGIIRSELLEDEYYAVEFDFTSDNNMHNCDGILKNNNGFYIPETHLKKVLY